MAKQRQETDKFFICPNCGSQVRGDARFCRECGASDESGWSEDDSPWNDESRLGLGVEEDFDYDEFLNREFPDRAHLTPKQRIRRWATAALVAIVTIAFLAWTLRPF
jgi:hypothetical protein